MKASIKFREEQKPLTRAKIPLSILGFPFQSGVVAGSPKELALSLATSFESGPSFKVSYRPNDTFNPFSVVFKTGIGRFGAPDPSPMIMSTEVDLIGSRTPRFFVKFKPRFGDFSIKKSQSSDFVTKRSDGGIGSGSDDDSIEIVAGAAETPTQQAAAMLCGVLRGTEASARTALPVMRQAALNFRWGFRFPAAGAESRGAVGKMPLLVMNKISIEHVADGKKGDERVESGGGDGTGDVVDTCRAVKRQLEMIQGENMMLRKGIDELRYEFATGKFGFPAIGAGGERKMKEERDGKEDLKKTVQ